MDKRNIVSILLICFLGVNIGLAITITSKNMDIIIQEYYTFFDQKGKINISFSSNISQVDLTAQNSKLKLQPSIYTISEVWLTITEIGLVGKDSADFTIFRSSNKIDLYEALESNKFLQSAHISEGFYSAIFLYLDGDIQVETTEGIKNLTIIGIGFLVIPINILNDGTETVDLEIIKNQTTDLLINFEVTLFWITNTAIVTPKTFLI